MELGTFLVFLQSLGQSNETIDIHNTNDGTENGSYDENDIIKTLNISDEATILNSEFNLNVEGFLKNIVLDKIPPAILLDNSTFSGINSFLISLSLFEKYGISYRTIRISYCPDLVIDINSSIYTCLFDGPSTNILETKYGDYLNNIKIEKSSNNYDLSFILNSSIGNIAINGLKIEIYDYAGNGIIYYNDMPFSIITDINFIPVEISFSNINPENLYVSQTEIGKCLVSVYNPEFNKLLWGSKIVANLTDDSVGSIVSSTIQLSKLNPEDSGINLLTFEVDNIVSSGKLTVEAWVDIGGNDALTTSIAAVTYNIASLGQWISECLDNTRKLNFKQYVPMYLKEDTEIYQYVKFLEDFFNTIYLEDTCNIGILEKIDRIKRSYDIDMLDNKYLAYYADNFGNTLNINLNDVKELIDVTNINDEILYKYIRNLYKNLPYINQYKGSDAAIIMVLKCFGCLPVLIKKWISRIEGDTSMIEVQQTGLEYKKQTSYFDPRYYYQYDKLRDYYLSSHFAIDLGYEEKTIKEIEKDSSIIKRVINGVKPTSRVLDELWYTIKVYFDGYLNYNSNNIYDSIETFETIRYYWSTVTEKDWLNVYTKGAFVESINNGKLITLTFVTNNTLKWAGKGTQETQGPYYNKPSNSYDFWYNIYHNIEMHNNNNLLLSWNNENNKYIFTKDNYKIRILDDTIELYLYGITAQSIPNTTIFNIWYYKTDTETEMFFNE